MNATGNFYPIAGPSFGRAGAVVKGDTLLEAQVLSPAGESIGLPLQKIGVES